MMNTITALGALLYIPLMLLGLQYLWDQLMKDALS